LQAFYGGPVWKANREAANETIIDSDNVLLLRPMRSDSGFSFENNKRPPRGAGEIPSGIVMATIYYLDAPADAGFTDFIERMLAPSLTESGASNLVCFVTENSKNTFPALPVREGENVLVWFACFQNHVEHNKFVTTLNQSQKWRDEVSKILEQHVRRSPEVLRLSPTARSQLR
jgi:hypothetical protein